MTETKRCEPCLGMGDKGRWRRSTRKRQWKIEMCRACDGRGQVESTRRFRARKEGAR